MVATLFVMALLPVHVSIGTYSPIYTPIDALALLFFAQVSRDRLLFC
jgi:hypothetical protein